GDAGAGVATDEGRDVVVAAAVGAGDRRGQVERAEALAGGHAGVGPVHEGLVGWGLVRWRRGGALGRAGTDPGGGPHGGAAAGAAERGLPALGEPTHQALDGDAESLHP